MRIGELSKCTNVSVDTLRFYSKEGLINYAVSGNYWSFDEEQIERVEQIKLLRNIGFSIKEIYYVFYASEELLDENDVNKEKLSEYRNFFEKKAHELDEKNKEIVLAQQKVEKILGKLELLAEMGAFEG